ncbi:helix-turn-helix domain-containing protein [Paenibacillus hemerocallicola]|uniref:Helix-turn-helix domain-containing protein n=1 Tax=Paenibacillus hemerocallicola TaxID=1172614 RepID=A0A5C4T341_9BACL|nr:AraC family transcriptional regulator [Paenibacillus hemerocallicola]TNJ63225.1 helix-turn-helix domain-containing protein [Paenibacillus hemerocallicola]
MDIPKRKPRYASISSDFMIFHHYDERISKAGPHRHDFHEIFLLLSGEVSYVVDDRKYKMYPGDMLLIHAGVTHYPIINDDRKVYNRMVLWIKKDYLNSLCTEETDLRSCFTADSSIRIITPDVTTYGSIKAAFDYLYQHVHMDFYGKDIMLRSYLEQLLVLINGINRHFSVLFETDDIEKDLLIDSVLNYISRNFQNDLSLDQIAERFYLNKYHLNRRFRKFTGVTMYKFITEKRLEYAKVLIVRGIPITEVYKHCGFGDYCNFYRLFKNKFGISPKRYFAIAFQEE